MRKSMEQRLAALYEKRTTLDQQIKQIETEKATALRKQQSKRERLVGQAVYALVEAGEWSEGQLRELMDKYLTRSAERQLFGLDEEPVVATNSVVAAPVESVEAGGADEMSRLPAMDSLMGTMPEFH